MNSEFIRLQPALYPAGEGTGISLTKPYGGFLSWYHTVVLAIALSVIYSNLPIYVYVLNRGLLPKFFFFGLVFLFAPLLLMKSRALGAYLISPFALWALVLIILNLIHFSSFAIDSGVSGIPLVNSQMESRNALILTRIQYIVFAWFLGFAVFTSNKQSYQYTFVFLAVLLPCAIVLDFVMPGLLYPIDTGGAVLGRAAAMFINPTMATEAILLAFLLSCAATKMKYRTLLFILLGAGILVTFTRSAMIAWVLLWPLLIAKRVLPKSAIIVTSIVLGTGLLFLGAFESYLGSRQDFDGALANIQARLDFFSNVTLDDDSSQERAEVIRAGWDLFLQNPIFGAGAGATHYWPLRGSTHNQLLMLAAEYGILGIGLWIWLAIILWKGEFFQNRNLQFAMAFLFVFMSMFTHLMFDSASYWLATFALVGVKKRQTTLYGPGGLT
jgi:O-antigen ligase